MTSHLDIAEILTPGRAPDYIGDESALEVAIAQAHALIDIAESLRHAFRSIPDWEREPLAGTPTPPDDPQSGPIVGYSILWDLRKPTRDPELMLSSDVWPTRDEAEDRLGAVSVSAPGRVVEIREVLR